MISIRTTKKLVVLFFLLWEKLYYLNLEALNAYAYYNFDRSFVSVTFITGYQNNFYEVIGSASFCTTSLPEYRQILFRYSRTDSYSVAASMIISNTNITFGVAELIGYFILVEVALS